jgi:thioredoxin 1
MTQLSNKHPEIGWSVLYFTGPGCQVCKVLEPQVRKMILEIFPEIEYRLYNVADDQAFAANHGVFTVPVILVLYGSKEYLREVRFISISQLKEKIARLLELSAR